MMSWWVSSINHQTRKEREISRSPPNKQRSHVIGCDFSWGTSVTVVSVGRVTAVHRLSSKLLAYFRDNVLIHMVEKLAGQSGG